MWHVIYWTSQAMTWIMLPMMQSYAKAGEFTVLGKIKYALIANALYYGTYLIIFCACLIYLAVKPDFKFDAAQLKVLAITASNTWGLFLLVLLLGYGLVDVPRTCWNNARRGYMLSRTLFNVAKLSIEKIEAEEELEDVLQEVKKLDDTVHSSHPCRRFVNIIAQKCPDSLQMSLTVTPRSRSTFDGSSDSGSDELITEKLLRKLHKRTIYAIQHHSSTQCQWRKVIDLAMELEDVAHNLAMSSRVFVRTNGVYDGVLKVCYSARLEWYWKCLAKPWGLRILAVILTVFSAMVVWSECLFFVHSPVLSLFALFVQLARANYNYFAIEFACVVTIFYLSFCAYYTIFKMRIFNYYNLVGNHQTNENSIIFCGMMLCRLTPPLCLNFLGLIHLDSHVTQEVNVVETAYTKIMGHMVVISFIADGFNIYFPIAIVLLCILTFFKVGNRLLHALGFQQFIGDDDMTQELMDEGTELVKRERRKLQRQEEMESRRKNWNERSIDQSGTGSVQAGKDSGSRKRAGVPGSLRAPNENDRSELLNNVEPMAYSGSSDASKSGLGGGGGGGGGLYQSSTAFRPQSLTADQGFSSSTARSSRLPARNIFDDV